MTAAPMKPGDTFTRDFEDRRRWVRFWCWLTRKPLPMRRELFKVTHVSSAGILVSVR